MYMVLPCSAPVPKAPVARRVSAGCAGHAKKIIGQGPDMARVTHPYALLISEAYTAFICRSL